MLGGVLLSFGWDVGVWGHLRGSKGLGCEMGRGGTHGVARSSAIVSFEGIHGGLD